MVRAGRTAAMVRLGSFLYVNIDDIHCIREHNRSINISLL